MKTTIFALCSLCFLCATAAFGQTAAVASGTAQPLQMSDHAQHASEHAMAQESSLFSTSTSSYAKGERPLSEFGTILKPETPLGDAARAVRKERTDAKAVKVVEN
jgi:hypothetical protein